MTGFLFEQVIFGPIRSRRLGISLGVNLLPLNRKVCTFSCLYCECGWTDKEGDCEAMGRGGEGSRGYPGREVVCAELEKKFAAMVGKKAMLTNITFAGNGEPTLHPEFAGIIDDTLVLRDRYYPDARISVLSNATMAGKDEVKRALMKVDQNILKLDAGTDETFQMINNPGIRITLEDVLENLKKFEGQMIIQTLFVRGSYKGVAFDNTTDAEVDAWLKHIDMLHPQLVMIYPVARATPVEDVQIIPAERLQEIAAKVEALGVRTEVYH